MARSGGCVMAIECEAWAGYRTVKQLVKGECAGYRPNQYVPPHYCCDVNGPCSLFADEPEPCPHFERRILPAVPTVHGRRKLLEAYVGQFIRDGEEMTPGIATQKALDEWQLYLQREARKCPECGRPMAARKQRCSACRKARQRALTRQRVRRHRDDSPV